MCTSMTVPIHSSGMPGPETPTQRTRDAGISLSALKADLAAVESETVHPVRIGGTRHVSLVHHDCRPCRVVHASNTRLGGASMTISCKLSIVNLSLMGSVELIAADAALERRAQRRREVLRTGVARQAAEHFRRGA